MVEIEITKTSRLCWNCNGSSDIAISTLIIQEMKNPDEIINEMSKVLQPQNYKKLLTITENKQLKPFAQLAQPK
jgi:ubiquinone/menaquinone biosynthesis C-methylase UbiE